MSAAAVAAVYRLTGIPMASKSLLNAIADSADDDGVCNPSLVHLSRKVGITDRHVRRVFKSLVEQGFIEVSPRQGFTNLCRLTPYDNWGSITTGVDARPVKAKGKPGRPAKSAAVAAVKEIAAPTAKRSLPTTPQPKAQPKVELKPKEQLKEQPKETPKAQPKAEQADFHEVESKPLYDAAELPRQASFSLELSPSLLDVEPAELALDPLLLPLRSGHGSVDLRPRVAEFQKSYPRIDVESEFLKLVAWNRTNTRKRKTRAGYEKHLSTWLGSAQDAAAKRPARPVSSHMLDQNKIDYKKDQRSDYRF
jgi:hypothetical protein